MGKIESIDSSEDQFVWKSTVEFGWLSSIQGVQERLVSATNIGLISDSNCVKWVQNCLQSQKSSQVSGHISIRQNVSLCLDTQEVQVVQQVSSQGTTEQSLVSNGIDGGTQVIFTSVSQITTEQRALSYGDESIQSSEGGESEPVIADYIEPGGFSDDSFLQGVVWCIPSLSIGQQEL